MGKIKSQFPVGSFFLKICGNDQGVIHLRYHLNGRYVSRSTGMKVDTKLWDKWKSPVRVTPEAQCR